MTGSLACSAYLIILCTVKCICNKLADIWINPFCMEVPASRSGTHDNCSGYACSLHGQISGLLLISAVKKFYSLSTVM